MKRSVSVEINTTTMAIFESLLRDGLVASGAVSEADNNNISMRSSKVKVEMDPKTVLAISNLLRDGLVASGAVSDADNQNVTQMTKKSELGR